MDILCLDLEGVLVPEVWLAVAESTGIEGLKKTTRDIPVYDDLMQYRLEILAEHDVPLSLIQAEIAKLAPLPGARDFLDWARLRFQVAIISDTLSVAAMPQTHRRERSYCRLPDSPAGPEAVLGASFQIARISSVCRR